MYLYNDYLIDEKLSMNVKTIRCVYFEIVKGN